MAVEHGHTCIEAIYDLGCLYRDQDKLDLALKYYLRYILFNDDIILDIVAVIPQVSEELQLDIVPQIRYDNYYFMTVPNTVHNLYMEKKIELSRRASNYLNYDIVSICLSYY